MSYFFHRKFCFSAAFALIISMLLGGVSLQAQTTSSDVPDEVGLWATKKEDGVFRIYQCGSALCGKLVGMEYKTPLPPQSSKGHSQCDYLMLTDFVKDKDSKKWAGKIADPRNEKIYDAKIWLSNKNELRVRGYMGISLFGETHVWHRFLGHIGQNCKLK